MDKATLELKEYYTEFEEEFTDFFEELRALFELKLKQIEAKF